MIDVNIMLISTGGHAVYSVRCYLDSTRFFEKRTDSKHDAEFIAQIWREEALKQEFKKGLALYD